MTGIDLETGSATPLHTTGGAVALGSVRGILPVGTDRLWLTVGAQVFIAETAGNLEIAFIPGYHEQLF